MDVIWEAHDLCHVQLESCYQTQTPMQVTFEHFLGCVHHYVITWHYAINQIRTWHCTGIANITRILERISAIWLACLKTRLLTHHNNNNKNKTKQKHSTLRPLVWSCARHYCELLTCFICYWHFFLCFLVYNQSPIYCKKSTTKCVPNNAEARTSVTMGQILPR